MDCAKRLELAGRWFLESGIQEPCGGVARYHRLDTGGNAPISTEITGYSISALLFLHAAGGDAALLDAAMAAGRFLTRTAWSPSCTAFPCDYPANGQPPAAFFFDSGIIVRGLLRLWRATGDTEFLNTAVECGEAMARDFAAECDYHPILALPDKKPWPREPRWSRSPGCYQLKAALGWYDLALETGRAEFRAHYDRVFDYALRTHASFLPGESDREKVMDRLHAYCYFLAGLLPEARNAGCKAALAEGIARTGALLREIAPSFERSDVNAQLLRVRLFADGMGLVPLDSNAAEEEAAAIVSYQMEDEDPRIYGGFCFGRKQDRLMPFMNPVSTAFCAQTLWFWKRHMEGRFEPDVRELI